VIYSSIPGISAPVDLLVVPIELSDFTIFTAYSWLSELFATCSISTSIPVIVDPLGIENPKLVALR